MPSIYIGKKHLDHFDFVSYNPGQVYKNQNTGETECYTEIKFEFLERYVIDIFGKEDILHILL